MDEHIEKTFTVGAEAALTLENIIGDIRLTAWDRPEVHVVATQRGRTRAEIEMNQEGDHVMVRTHDRWLGSFLRWLGGERPPIVDYTVEVPAGCEVRVSEVDGLVALAGLRRQARLSLVSGRAQTEDLEGEVEVSLVSARLEGKNLRGQAALKTVSGDIGLESCRLEALTVSTVSGRVQVATPLAPQGRYRCHSVSGDIILAVSAGTRCTALGETVSGRLHSELPGPVERQSFANWRAAINGGGVEVHFDSVSADLHLRSMAAAEATPGMAARPVAAAVEVPQPSPEPISQSAEMMAQTSPPPPQPMTTMEVLKAVEAGQLSVDEALKRLTGAS